MLYCSHSKFRLRNIYRRNSSKASLTDGHLGAPWIAKVTRSFKLYKGKHHSPWRAVCASPEWNLSPAHPSSGLWGPKLECDSESHACVLLWWPQSIVRWSISHTLKIKTNSRSMSLSLFFSSKLELDAATRRRLPSVDPSGPLPLPWMSWPQGKLGLHWLWCQTAGSQSARGPSRP